jgi:hypothetical protein
MLHWACDFRLQSLIAIRHCNCLAKIFFFNHKLLNHCRVYFLEAYCGGKGQLCGWIVPSDIPPSDELPILIP